MKKFIIYKKNIKTKVSTIQTVIHRQNLLDRKGYDEKFLNKKLTLP